MWESSGCAPTILTIQMVVNNFPGDLQLHIFIRNNNDGRRRNIALKTNIFVAVSLLGDRIYILYWWVIILVSIIGFNPLTDGAAYIRVFIFLLAY